MSDFIPIRTILAAMFFAGVLNSFVHASKVTVDADGGADHASLNNVLPAINCVSNSNPQYVQSTRNNPGDRVISPGSRAENSPIARCRNTLSVDRCTNVRRGMRS